MRLKAAVKYQLSDKKSSLLAFYGVIYLVFLLLLTLQSTPGEVTIGGLDTPSMIFIFISSLISFGQSFKMFLQNGLSRRTLFVSFLAGAAALALAMAAVDNINSLIFSRVASYSSTFMQIYQSAYQGAGAAGVFLTGLLWSFTLLFLLALCGLFIGSLYYRMNKWQKLAVSVGTPALLFVILPAFDLAYLHGAISRAVADFMSFALGLQNGVHPFYPPASFLVAAAILAGLSYLLIRKAPAKE